MNNTIFANVNLITVEEAEAMVNDAAKVITGKVTDSTTALEAEVKRATNAETELTDKVADEAKLRETTDDALLTRLVREEGVRQTADEEIMNLISTEQTTRQDADRELTEAIAANTAAIATEVEDRTKADDTLTTVIDAEKLERETGDKTNAEAIATEVEDRKKAIEELKETKADTFEDSVYCARMSNLPIAQMTVENKDKIIAVGDILGSVSADYLPKIPVTFSFVSEVTEDDASKYAYLSCRLDANGNIVVINKTVLSETYEGNINSATVMYITKD